MTNESKTIAAIKTTVLRVALKRLLAPKKSIWYLSFDVRGALVGDVDGTIRVDAMFDLSSVGVGAGFILGPVAPNSRYSHAATLKKIVANWKNDFVFFRYDRGNLIIQNDDDPKWASVSYSLPVEKISPVEDRPKTEESANSRKNDVFDPFFLHDSVTPIGLSDAQFSGDAVFFFKSNRGKNNVARNIVFETADGIYFSAKKRAFDAARSLLESDTAAIKYLLDCDKKNIAAYRMSLTPRGAKFIVPGDTPVDYIIRPEPGAEITPELIEKMNIRLRGMEAAYDYHQTNGKYAYLSTTDLGADDGLIRLLNDNYPITANILAMQKSFISAANRQLKKQLAEKEAAAPLYSNCFDAKS